MTSGSSSSQDNNDNNKDNRHPPGNQLSDLSSQEVDSMFNDILNNIRLTQDLFKSSTPGKGQPIVVVAAAAATTTPQTHQLLRESPRRANKQAGMLPNHPSLQTRMFLEG